ncbi:hypothetical protein COV13_01125 [Candidatus Woesearchaeota archaeon CG10_big_fil_rev_8_21_14_0_10_32_9]|nr:MAG: hypothetical protein COV13_01125 [Candidatus Woesearchaeota archaeon CG10_big_fil_rev_8_21_14_0_10_32_9]
MKIKDIINQDKFSKNIRLEIFKKILSENLKITNEKLLIIGDKGLNDNLVAPIMTNAYALAAEELGIKYETIYQNYKARSEPADDVVVKKISSLPKKSVLVINISNRVGNLQSIGKSLRTYIKENQHRFVSSSSLGSVRNEMLPFIIDCLDVDYKALDSKTKQLKEKITSANEINVTTKAGTDLTFNIKGVECCSASGVYTEPGTGGNLPGSEVYMPPLRNNVEGTLVIDGSARIKDRTILVKHPIRVDIKKGFIHNISGGFEAKLLRDTLEWAHLKSKHPETIWRIGELGIGLNNKAKIIGSTIIDEKAYGTAHVAIGSNAWFGGDIKSIIHLDQVFKEPIIKLDGKLLKY